MKFSFSKNIFVNKKLREELSKPFGKLMNTEKLIKYIKNYETVYAIGDVTLSELLKQGRIPKVGIFDYRTERDAVQFPIIRETYKNPLCVKNRRGELSTGLWQAVEIASKSKKPVGIRVYGEEDLASLACIYFAKNGDIVVYGMRGMGMSVIKINKKIKDYIVRVLKIMSIS